jgi:hypothetical protein
MRPTSEHTHTKRAKTWTPQKEENAEWRESFVHRQTHFSVNNDNAATWKYIKIQCSATVSKNELFHEDVILMLF